MRTSRAGAVLGAVGLAVSTVVVLTPAASADDGRGAEPDASAFKRSTARSAEVAAAVSSFGEELEMPASYPFEPKLEIYPDHPGDASDSGRLLGHDDLAPMLMDWMETSNRLSVQVVGQSTAGRDLYLATVTAPETPQQTAQQTVWREKITENPAAAATDVDLQAGYKTPIWISNNIHGNEWEGTDAAMQVIEDLVEAPWTEVRDLLRDHRIYFSLSLNPDGRTLGTRATALSLDANRDMITNTTPETRSYIKTAQAIQPLYAADFHGYTSVLQVEPCGPPHGENYEYDLFLPQAYATALAVEEDVVAAAIPGNTYFNVETRQVVPENTGPETAHIKIPYRDTPSGWDDYPPIFTAQYAAFFGASTSTVELPKSRPNSSTQTPENAAVNTEVARVTMESMIEYFSANDGDFLANQIEMFRRGVAGEPKDSLTLEEVADVPGPDQWKEHWDVVDDQDPVTLPRAYVIPVGDDQRSESDADRLVEQLLLHDIEVGTLDAAATIAGTTYPAGSYVVDMHQPLRGLANSLLDLGSDISAKVPSMYDISAWSYSYTWGATVDKAGLVEDGPLPAYTPIDAAASNADMPADAGAYLAFDLAGVADFQALNALLDAGEDVSLLADGTAVLGPGSRTVVEEVSADFDIDVDEASANELDALDDETTKGLTEPTVAYVGNQDDKLSLTELGFDDLVPVTAQAVTADPTLVTDADLLWVGAGFNLTDPGARAAVQDWVDAGHSIVGRTHQAFNVATSFGLLSGTAVSGNGSGNGIVAVDTPAGSPLAPHGLEHSFIYPAYWFTELGEGTHVAQSYDAEDPFLAGHWRPGSSQGNPLPNGPADAAGNAAVVYAEKPSGARSMVFGTSVFYRNHPKGLLGQAARGIFWAAPEGEGVRAPSATSLEVSAPTRTTYPAAPTVTVTASSEAGTPTGTVELLDGRGRVVASGELDDGVARISVPGLRPGTATLVASYVSSTGSFEPATSAAFAIRVAKARSTTALQLVKKAGRKATLRITVAVAGVRPTGTVLVKDGTRTVRRVSVPRSGRATVVVRLGKGVHRLKAVRPATALVAGSASKVVKVRVG